MAPTDVCSCGSENFAFDQLGNLICEMCGITGVQQQIGGYSENVKIGCTKIAGNIEEDISCRWTYFEAFNTILYKWCSILEDFGISSSIYDGVFTVWFKYLEECNIFSNDGKKFLLHRRDLIYFGQKTTKKERKLNIDRVISKASNKGAGDGNVSYISKYVLQDKLSTIKGENEDDVDVLMEDFIEDMEADHTQTKETERHNFSLHSQTGDISKNFFINLKIDKVLAIFYLGIRMADVNIFASDIIRWCRQGRLPYFSAMHLLGENKTMNTIDLRVFRQPLICTMKINCFSGLFATFISIPIIPVLEYSQVWERFVEELNLPAETNDMCQLLYDKIHIMNYPGFSLPNIELTAACFIILALKVCFGIDDNHETLLSHWAHKVNKETQETADVCILFSFTKWQRYIDKTYWWHGQIAPFNEMTEKCSSYDSHKLKSHFYHTGSKRFAKLKMKAWTKVISINLSDMNDAKEEKDCSEKNLFSPFNSTTGLFSQYIFNNKEHPPSEHLLQVADELQSISFKDNMLNWIMRPDCIERVLSKKIEHEVVLISLAFNEVIEKTGSLKRQNKTIRVLLPDPKLSYWEAKKVPHSPHENYEKELPQNFCWLITVISKLCETSKFNVLKRFYSVEHLYCKSAKIETNP